MRKSLVFVYLFFLLVTTNIAHGQDLPRFGLSFERDQLRNFRIDNENYNESRSYTFRISFYEQKYTNIEYSLHHTRGYHESISYSFGLSAVYVLSLSDDVLLKPGLSLDAFKLKDRKCKSIIKSMIQAMFDVDNSECDDDQHTSFTPRLTAEIKISDPMSLVFRTDYRFMYSIVDEERVPDENSTESPQPDARKSGTDHSFYGAGLGFGAGIRYNF